MRHKILAVFALVLALLIATSCAADPSEPSSDSSLSSGTNSLVSSTQTDTENVVSSGTDPESAPSQTDTDSDPVSSSTHPTDTSEKGTSSVSQNTGTTVDIPEKTVTDLAIACDQTVGRVVVYDLEQYDGTDLENCVVWSYTPPLKSGSTVHRSKLMSGVKYRTGTVFGDVVLMCASGRYAEVVTYPGKEVIWRDEWTVKNVDQQDKGVKNPHSIEILPSGNVLVCGSTGNIIRLFYTCVRVDNPSAKVTSVKYELSDAHGLLWDPEYQILWALGQSELVAYTVSGSGTEETLVKSKSYPLPTSYGHDLSADFRSVQHLWITTGSCVYRFDKETGKFSAAYANSIGINRSSVKGYGNNRNGHSFMTFPNGGTGTSWSSESFASWCTNRIRYFYYDASGKLRLKDCVSSTGAFYKVFSFQGEYQ